MDDQRQAGEARRGDVAAQAYLLRFLRCIVVKVVEPGFTDTYNLWMRRKFDQLIDRSDGLFLRRLVTEPPSPVGETVVARLSIEPV